MRVAEEQKAYTVPPEERGYRELSSAIVCTAIKDYRRARKFSFESSIYRDLREFFLSEVFENLSGCDNPNMFLMRLDEEIDKEIASGSRRKREKQVMKCNG